MLAVILVKESGWKKSIEPFFPGWHFLSLRIILKIKDIPTYLRTVYCRIFVSRWGGKQFEYMGRATPDGSLELLPEEALFLIESSSLGGYWYRYRRYSTIITDLSHPTYFILGFIISVNPGAGPIKI